MKFIINIILIILIYIISLYIKDYYDMGFIGTMLVFLILYVILNIFKKQYL